MIMYRVGILYNNRFINYTLHPTFQEAVSEMHLLGISFIVGGEAWDDILNVWIE